VVGRYGLRGDLFIGECPRWPTSTSRDDFRPDYGRLGEVRTALGRPPVLAFTATAGVDAQQRIIKSLDIPDAQVIVHGVDRPNIGFMRLQVPEPHRARVISDLLPGVLGKVMIFVPSIRKGDELQAKLKSLGHDLPFYHGQIQPPHKRETLQLRPRTTCRSLDGLDETESQAWQFC
jgi:ATP-dependent DNA helicase RecQ